MHAKLVVLLLLWVTLASCKFPIKIEGPPILGDSNSNSGSNSASTHTPILGDSSATHSAHSGGIFFPTTTSTASDSASAATTSSPAATTAPPATTTSHSITVTGDDDSSNTASSSGDSLSGGSLSGGDSNSLSSASVSSSSASVASSSSHATSAATTASHATTASVSSTSANSSTTGSVSTGGSTTGGNNTVYPYIIINEGPSLWSIVKNNQPYENVTAYGTGTPKGLTDLNQLKNWVNTTFVPGSMIYRVVGKNGNAVHFSWELQFAWGADYEGVGMYLDYVTIIPTRTNVFAFFYLEAQVHVLSPLNVGNKDAPVAGMQVDLEWQVHGPLGIKEGTASYFIQGDGNWKCLSKCDGKYDFYDE